MWGLQIVDVLTSLKVPKDVEFSRGLDTSVPWIHRRAGEANIYFVANRSDRDQDIDARFRVTGKEAEFWHADTGAIEQADYSIANGLTSVPLHLSARESVFVVFRKSTASPTRATARAHFTTLITIGTSWSVSFPANLGAPAKMDLAQLESWTTNKDEGVKYFSGTATYSNTVQAPRAWFRPGEQIFLDLGIVDDLAEISINGKALGTLWKLPYRVDITQALRPGANQLEIKVTNEWTNRLTGDRSAPPDRKVLSPPPGNLSAPIALKESGLLGPVTIVSLVPR